jgi:hypothetical protein
MIPLQFMTTENKVPVGMNCGSVKLTYHNRLRREKESVQIKGQCDEFDISQQGEMEHLILKANLVPRWM